MNEEDLIPCKSYCANHKSVVKLAVLNDGGEISIVVDDKFKINLQYLNNFILPSLERNMEGLYEIEEVAHG